MAKVKITAIRQTTYPDLMAKYENPIQHPCSIQEGQQVIFLSAIDYLQNFQYFCRAFGN